MEQSLDELLFQAVTKNDLDAVNSFLTQGANPNEPSRSGKTPLGAAASLGNTAVLKTLLHSSSSANPLSLNSERKPHRAQKKRSRNDRCSPDYQWKHNCYEEFEVHDIISPIITPTSDSSCTKFHVTSGSSKNHGYFVFVHEDRSLTDELTSRTCCSPTSPESCSDLEWDEDVGKIAPSTREDETWSSLYKWYASILEYTGAALACPMKDRGIEQQDRSSRTALHYAAQQGHVPALKLLLDAGCNANHHTDEGITPLDEAVLHNHISTARALLDGGADANDGQHDRATPLFIAVHNGNTDMVEMLLDAGGNLEGRNGEDLTPLMVAARHGHLDTLRLLLARGANVNKENIEGLSAVYYARRSGDTEVLRVLLSAGARVVYSQQLMHSAIVRNEVELVKLLASVGVLDVPDLYGFTPLHLAVRFGFIEIAEVLLQSGASAKVNNSLTGRTVLHEAVECVEDPSQFQYLLLQLLQHGADVDEPSLAGDTPLNTAILLDREHQAIALVQHGANVNDCDIQMCVYDNLHLALRSPSPTLANILVKAGHVIPCVTQLDQIPRHQYVNAYLIHICTQPMELVNLCRIVIRRNSTKPLYKFVQGLHIPNLLKSFLMLENEVF